MKVREYLIAGIQEQHDILQALIQEFERKESMSLQDCLLYEETTKEVENSLKSLRKTAARDLIKEINTANAINNKLR